MSLIVELLRVVLAMKGEITEHFDVFRSTRSEQHGYNTQNCYMAFTQNWQAKNGMVQNKTYCKAITDWASLPDELKKPMPKRLFKHKLKQFLLT